MTGLIMPQVYFSVEAAAMYIKRFDGLGGILEANRFIEDCETMYMNVAQEKHQQLLLMIKAKMQWMIPGPNTYNWPQLKQLLQEAFAQPMDIARWQEILISCFQLDDENVTKYSDRLSMYYHYLVCACTYGKSPEMIEEIRSVLNIQAIKVFINGLKEPTKTNMMEHTPKTLACAITLALAEEEYTLPFTYLIHLRCAFCKRKGHFSKNCVDNPRLIDACMSCNEFGHKTNNCIRSLDLDNRSDFVPAAQSARTEQSTETESMCISCMVEPVDTSLYKCGHMCLCNTCACLHRVNGTLAKCPVCRATVEDCLKIYS